MPSRSGLNLHVDFQHIIRLNAVRDWSQECQQEFMLLSFTARGWHTFDRLPLLTGAVARAGMEWPTWCEHELHRSDLSRLCTACRQRKCTGRCPRSCGGRSRPPSRCHRHSCRTASWCASSLFSGCPLPTESSTAKLDSITHLPVDQPKQSALRHAAAQCGFSAPGRTHAPALGVGPVAHGKTLKWLTVMHSVTRVRRSHKQHDTTTLCVCLLLRLVQHAPLPAVQLRGSGVC